MSREDVRTFAWLVPLALALLLWWMFWADPCLDNEIAKYWPTQSRPVAEVAAKQFGVADEVAIENPYGITSCCFLNGPDRLAVFSILFVIALFIGFLSAWNLQQRAGRRAAATTFTMLSLVLAFSQLVYLPESFQYFEQQGHGSLMHAALYLLLLALGAGAISWLSAMVTLRFRPRG